MLLYCQSSKSPLNLTLEKSHIPLSLPYIILYGFIHADTQGSGTLILVVVQQSTHNGWDCNFSISLTIIYIIYSFFQPQITVYVSLYIKMRISPRHITQERNYQLDESNLLSNEHCFLVQKIYTSTNRVYEFPFLQLNTRSVGHNFAIEHDEHKMVSQCGCHINPWLLVRQIIFLSACCYFEFLYDLSYPLSIDYWVSSVLLVNSSLF